MKSSQRDHAANFFLACSLVAFNNLYADLHLFGFARLWLASISAKTKKQSHRQN
jgi:hypothetical protein